MIGGITGFIGGRLDLVTQRFVDAWMAFPGLLLLQIIIVLGVSGGIRSPARLDPEQSVAYGRTYGRQPNGDLECHQRTEEPVPAHR